MRIQIASDLHFEHYHKDECKLIIEKLKKEGQVDNIILAGDISDYRTIFFWLKEFAKNYKNVFYVHGNHECWGGSINQLYEIYYEYKINKEYFPNIHWLWNDIFELEGIRFLGTTLWFDYKEYFRNIRWSDFKRIDNGVEAIKNQNEEAKKFLKENLRENDVVITHHFPIEECIHEKYKDDPYNDFFLCDQKELIKERKPKIYFHGHSHEKFDFMFENTRIVANPKGYPEEKDIGEFNWSKIIEI